MPRSSCALIAFALVSCFLVSAQELSDSEAVLIAQRLAEGATHSWELGTRAQTILSANATRYSVLSVSQSLPPPQTIPDSLSSAMQLFFQIAHDVVANRSASNGNITGPQPLIQDGSAADPASIGFAVLLANWTGQGGEDYAGAALDQLNFLEFDVPRTSDGAISHRVSEVQLWSDFVYMVPPFLAYYGMITSNRTLLLEAYNQISLYRNYLLDPSANNLWKHVLLGTSGNDEGHWSTGNGWAAAGMLRVLGTYKNSEFSNTLTQQQNDLASWVLEIQAAMYPHLDNTTTLFTNYADQPVTADGNFYDSSSTALLASTVYRLSLIWGTHTYLPYAERCRKALSAANTNSSSNSSYEHFDVNGWLTPVVDPYSYGLQGSQSPEGQAFVVDMQSAWRDWVQAGSKGANGASHVHRGLSIAGWMLHKQLRSSSSRARPSLHATTPATGGEVGSPGTVASKQVQPPAAPQDPQCGPASVIPTPVSIPTRTPSPTPHSSLPPNKSISRANAPGAQGLDIQHLLNIHERRISTVTTSTTFGLPDTNEARISNSSTTTAVSQPIPTEVFAMEEMQLDEHEMTMVFEEDDFENMEPEVAKNEIDKRDSLNKTSNEATPEGPVYDIDLDECLRTLEEQEIEMFADLCNDCNGLERSEVRRVDPAEPWLADRSISPSNRSDSPPPQSDTSSVIESIESTSPLKSSLEVAPSSITDDEAAAKWEVVISTRRKNAKPLLPALSQSERVRIVPANQLNWSREKAKKKAREIESWLAFNDQKAAQKAVRVTEAETRVLEARRKKYEAWKEEQEMLKEEEAKRKMEDDAGRKEEARKKREEAKGKLYEVRMIEEEERGGGAKERRGDKETRGGGTEEKGYEKNKKAARVRA
ncbi:hypothetical protein H0H92_011342 [Tricholoma furcatifolium]|nr:hypothetical protein H0H92_011342 [Tricholoma furcatifolium]